MCNKVRYLNNQTIEVKFMPQSSRYSDQQIEELLTELAKVLEMHKTPIDLSLMVLGNMVTNLINSSITPNQRYRLAESFSDALRASIKEEKAH